MNTINFLPIELKEKRIHQKSISLDISLFLIVFINVTLIFHILFLMHNLDQKYKEPRVNEVRVNSSNVSTLKLNALNFFKENINGKFNCEAVSINKERINIKFNLTDKNQFTEYVNKIDNIKECEIEYLVAPYEEDGNYKFDVGIEVLK